MTEYQRKQVQASIAECDRFIEKESKHSADLRPARVQQMLDHAIAHKAKLVAMLESNVEIPSPFIKRIEFGYTEGRDDVPVPVRLDGRIIGEIRPVAGGWQYFPNEYGTLPTANDVVLPLQDWTRYLTLIYG